MVDYISQHIQLCQVCGKTVASAPDGFMPMIEVSTDMIGHCQHCDEPFDVTKRIEPKPKPKPEPKPDAVQPSLFEAVIV